MGAATFPRERVRVDFDPALLPSLLAAPPPAPVVLRGAKVSDEAQAADAAIAAYFARAGGMRALQSVRVVGANAKTGRPRFLAP